MKIRFPVWDAILNGKRNFIEMKKSLLIVIVFLAAVSQPVLAQIEINVYGGYVPNSKTMYSYNGYRLKIDGNGNFGVGLGYNTPFGIVGELSYMRYSSTLSQDGGIVEIVDPQPINVEYYQLGLMKPLMDGETFIPYGLFSLGASRFNPTEVSEDYWRFAVNLGVGMKYFFTDKVGIKVQARMLMPLYFGGIGFGCGIGTGGSSCGGGAYFGAEIIQGDFTGGVVLRLGE
jgi:opacity protein-like surface antigen